MNSVAFTFGNLNIYTNALIIDAAVAVCALLTLIFYKTRTGKAGPVLAFLPLSYILAVLIGRFMHWYFTSSNYPGGLLQAFSDFSVGSFALMGVVAGPWIAAYIIKSLRLCKNAGRLLDCIAPGLCLVIAAIKFGAWFTDTNRGRKISSDFLTFLPIAVKSTDAAGNVSYRFATFFIAGLLMLLAFFIIFSLYKINGQLKMLRPCPKAGHIWNMFLALFGAIEIVMDSTRTDSLLMHFRFLHSLNAYSAFISLGQVFAICTIAFVFVYYLVYSIKANGFGVGHVVAIVLFLLTVFCVGYLGEYKIQRCGGEMWGPITKMTRGYILMVIGCFLLYLIPSKLYNSCIYDPDDDYE